MTNVSPPEARPEDPPSGPPSAGKPYPTLIAMALVLGCSTTFLLMGHNLQDALIGAAGMALIGSEVARRVLSDAGPLPIILVTSAVAAFGAVLIALGYDVHEAALGAGLAGLIAGETAGRMFGSVPRPWRGV
jgi:hypothetical protein